MSVVAEMSPVVNYFVNHWGGDRIGMVYFYLKPTLPTTWSSDPPLCHHAPRASWHYKRDDSHTFQMWPCVRWLAVSVSAINTSRGGQCRWSHLKLMTWVAYYIPKGPAHKLTLQNFNAIFTAIIVQILSGTQTKPFCWKFSLQQLVKHIHYRNNICYPCCPIMNCKFYDFGNITQCASIDTSHRY